MIEFLPLCVLLSLTTGTVNVYALIYIINRTLNYILSFTGVFSLEVATSTLWKNGVPFNLFLTWRQNIKVHDAWLSRTIVCYLKP